MLYNINSSLIKIQIQKMIISKKLKPIEEKTRIKSVLGQGKKGKKQKMSSPSKLKTTPQKKRPKKDENSQLNKPSSASVQQLQYFKSKQSQRQSHVHKKSQNKEMNRSKLLNTTPLNFHKKSKSKSKQKSVSKLNTYRSTQDKEICKSIKKTLFQNRQNKSNSKDKSKSRSRLKTDRDVSPLKQIKPTKLFNVADREIKYNKNQTQQLKKTLKKKIQNTRSKAEPFIFPSNNIDEDPIEEPKMKFKKNVPHIKTEFSQRRGSYFDENLLKKLQINHQEGKKAQNCPFIHIKSNFENFQQRFKESRPFYSKRDTKVSSEQLAQSNSFQSKQVQIFKLEQQKKLQSLLIQLKSLKNQPKISERIDHLIQYLNDNYTNLQQRRLQLQRKQPQHRESNVGNQNSRKNSMTEQLSLDSSLLPNKSSFNKNKIQIQYIENREKKDGNELPQSKQPSLNFLSPISYENNFKAQAPSENQNNQNKEEEVKALNKEQIEQDDLTFKRSNNINLSEFYNFLQKKQVERKIEFEPFIRVSEDIYNMSLDFMKPQQDKASDKNILNQLNILDNSQDFIDAPQGFKNKTFQFKQEMQKIRIDQEVISITNDYDLDYPNNFHSQVKINEEMSSQSLLLNISENNNRRTQKIVGDIQQSLIGQFCISILRSKNILHNFITTYSELVENNAINVQTGFSYPQSEIEASNDYVFSIVSRLINHIEVNYKQQFLHQIKLPFQCKPIEILKYIRCSQEDIEQTNFQEDQMNALQIPYFNEEKIEEFQLHIIQNQCFIPGYFSFNHCIYDQFNDIIEELRPYGSRGKAIFSLQLSHQIRNFDVARTEILQRVNRHLTEKYFQEKVPDEKYPNEQGIFELIYFTSLDLVDLIVEQQVQNIWRTINRSNLKKHAF